MLGKPWEFWAVIVGMAIYVATRDAESEHISKRLAKTIASGLLTFGLAPEVAPYLGGNEIAAAVVIMAFGLIVLDLVTAVIMDRDFMQEIIKSKLGGGKK